MSPSPFPVVDASTGRKPKNVALITDWAYVEHSLLRLLAAWGRYLPRWEDKVAIHRHLWEASECVQLLRNRLVEFPGTTSNLDAPVSPRLQVLADTVLLAPSWQDALDGIYAHLLPALTTAYLQYATRAHPVHDAPTLSVLHQILGYKNGLRLWYREFRRQNPHQIDAAYAAAIQFHLDLCQELQSPTPMTPGEPPAAPCGVRTGFRQPARPARPPASAIQHDLYAPLEADFATSIEARRLFWCIGYMREMGLAEDMLRWVWAAHYMPWGYQKELARHLWDESRHGDSGYSRLKDFGISLGEAGYHQDPRGPWNESGELETVPMMTPAELFEAAFFIGMIAETGHFTVKNEAYNDFKNGGDLESAEMMIFDIIDEGSHVRYCHEWLPELAARAGIDLGDYRARSAAIREDFQQKVQARIASLQATPFTGQEPACREYQRLMAVMRAKHPLSNAGTCPPRSIKPM